MDLINFDDDLVKQSSPLPPPLIPEGNIELSPDFSNPIETADHLVRNANDPFECLDLITSLDMIRLSSKDDLNLRDGSSFSFDCFSNTSQHADTTSTNTANSRKSVSRCHSDTSTISSRTAEQQRQQQQNDFVNRSAESINAPSKQQQLLKLSFFNSPNSPINASSNYSNDPAMIERISQEAKKISRHFAMSTDSSFEDLNNVSQSLIDNSTDSINDEFRDMKVDLRDIKVESDTPVGSPSTPISDKIAIFQKQLQRIKQEQEHECIDVDALDEDVKVKVEEVSPIKIEDSPSPPKQPIKREKLEMESMLNNLKQLVASGRNEEAKRQLGKLSDLLASQQEPAKTVQVQPMIREGTFEIDKKTGKRIYANGNRPQAAPTPQQAMSKSHHENILEKIQSIINTDASLKVHNVQLMDSSNSSSAPIVVLVQKDMSTPMKYPRLPNHKPTSVVRALEGNGRKLATPARSNTASQQQASTLPRNSLTAPRPSAGQGKLHPYDQRLSQQKAGNVRKSLMTTIDKSPKERIAVKTATKTASSAAARPVSVRRSVSMKASVQINTGSGAAKPTQHIRPTTVSARKIAEAMSLSKPSSTTPLKQPSSAIKARTASTRTSFLRGVKKPAFDHGSLV